MTAQVHASHPSAFIHMRKRPFEKFSTCGQNSLAWQLVNLVKNVTLKISLPANGRPQTSNHPAIESPFPFLLRSVSMCLPLARLECSSLILRAVIQY